MCKSGDGGPATTYCVFALRWLLNIPLVECAPGAVTTQNMKTLPNVDPTPYYTAKPRNNSCGQSEGLLGLCWSRRGWILGSLCCPLWQFSCSPQSHFGAAPTHGGVQSQDLRNAGSFAGSSPRAQTPAPGLQVGHAWKMKEKETAAMTASTRAC